MSIQSTGLKITESLRTPIAICRWPNLNPEKPKLNQLSNAEQWDITLLFDPEGKEVPEFIQKLEDLKKEYQKKFGRPPSKGLTLKTIGKFASDKDAHLPEANRRLSPAHLVGMLSMVAKRNAKTSKGEPMPPVMICGPQKDPVEYSTFYSGCVVRAAVDIVSYDTFGGGLGTYLNAVQFIRNGQSLGGGQDGMSLFESEEVELDINEDLI